uniref:Tyrosine-protein kinase n=1 Tax=Parastrongyloides trichosuri TaxID=131310 RepID=A0A0N4ZNK1_PARTI
MSEQKTIRSDALTDQVSSEILSELLQLPYYHGFLPREDMRRMLLRPGDFLVRLSQPAEGKPRTYVLSVAKSNGNARLPKLCHYLLIKDNQGKYIVEHNKFETIKELVDFYWKKGTTTSEKSELVLLNPISRKPWELDHCTIETTKRLGEGAFAICKLGKYIDPKNKKVIDCAIKVLKLEKLTKKQIKEFSKECRLMRKLDHPNIVKFYGLAAQQEPLMLVMELVKNGSLDHYLMKNTIEIPVKIKMCHGAGKGLNYLHSLNIMHRDIAARNCLVDADEQIKISDFGMSVMCKEFDLDPTDKVPVKFLAPETLRYKKYYHKTDVFTYGILVWEIFSNAKEPYPGMTALEMIKKVCKEEYRMAFPPETPDFIKNCIYSKAWLTNPEDRASMSEIVKIFGNGERSKMLPPVETIHQDDLDTKSKIDISCYDEPVKEVKPKTTKRKTCKKNI